MDPPPARRHVTHARVASAISSGTDAAMSINSSDTKESDPAPKEAPAEEPVPTQPLYLYKDYTPEPIRVYTRSVSEVNDHLPFLRGPLGFDMEWKVILRRPQTVRPTAIVQICDERYIWIVQVSAMRNCKSLFSFNPQVHRLDTCSGFPFALKKILEDPKVPKIGVNIRSGYSFHCPIPLSIPNPWTHR